MELYAIAVGLLTTVPCQLFKEVWLHIFLNHLLR